MLVLFVFAFIVICAREIYDFLRSLNFGGGGGSGLVIRGMWIAVPWRSYDFRAETVEGGGFASELVFAFAVIGAEELRCWRVGSLGWCGFCYCGGFGGEVVGYVFCLWYARKADFAS